MFLHVDDNNVRALLLQGEFGLERENLRVTKDGSLVKTRHPMVDNMHITMDFAENQVEIKTPVFTSVEEVIESLRSYTDQLKVVLAAREEKEYLWPFSTPPYIDSELDIPIAYFSNESDSRRRYREYLSERYGRYKMALCGIHVNYSFSKELLLANYQASYARRYDYETYKDLMYLSLAEHLVNYSWLLTALTAASPLTDRSYVEPSLRGGFVFTGVSSLRCGENGYWNHFTPIFNYESLKAYIDSVGHYVDKGLIISPSELYYPVRLKPSGSYDLDSLRANGVNHIELRLFDLNPLSYDGMDIRDLEFVRLLITFLASSKEDKLSPKDQLQAVENMKNAARYDLKNVKIIMPQAEEEALTKAGQNVIGRMRNFYELCAQCKAKQWEKITAVLDYEEEKLIDPKKRYANILRESLGEEYVKNGCKMMLKYQ